MINIKSHETIILNSHYAAARASSSDSTPAQQVNTEQVCLSQGVALKFSHLDARTTTYSIYPRSQYSMCLSKLECAIHTDPKSKTRTRCERVATAASEWGPTSDNASQQESIQNKMYTDGDGGRCVCW